MLKTRLFDAVGILSVTCWIGILAAFVYQQISPQEIPHASSLSHSEIAITEGNTWLVLNRDKTDVGYIHESRTRVDEHWLFEYEMMMIVEVGAMQQLIDTHTRATLDEDGFLQKFQGDISSFMGTFSAKGEVTADQISIELDLAGRTTTRTVSISEPPRLSNTAINQLIARPQELIPGKRYEQEFFDPMQQQMSNLSYVYIEEKQIDVYGVTQQAYHFEQELMGDRFDVYINADGEILIQEFPMRTVASRLPEALGKTRTSAIKRQLKKGAKGVNEDADAALTEQAKQTIQPQELGLTGSLKSLSNLLTGQKNADAADAGVAPDDPDMSSHDLSSPDTNSLPDEPMP